MRRRRHIVGHPEDAEKKGLMLRTCLSCMGTGALAPVDIEDGVDICEECLGHGKVMRAPQPW